MKSDDNHIKSKNGLKKRLNILSYSFGISWIVQPLEVVRTQVIISKYDGKGKRTFILRILNQIYESEGIAGFWRGSIM